jgi:hypothetical protein
MLPPLLALAMLSPEIKPTQRGSDLFHSCKADVRFDDQPSSVTSADLDEARRCQAYIDGFLDGNERVSPAVICADSATVGTIARVYVAFMEQHPILMDAPKGLGFYQALAEAYPCRAKR